MKFGIFALPTYFPELDGTIQEFYGSILALMRESERLGFDMAWCNEHHFHEFGGMIPAPAVLLSAVAAQTTRIRLGTSVALLPLHHPLEQAEAYAMVDQISRGRLELGLGRGYLSFDYIPYGVDYATAQERLYESLEVIRKAWQQQPFSHQGQFYAFEGVSVWPVPFQQPHPPIWGSASRSDESFRWWGAHGYDLLTVVFPFKLERLQQQIQLYRDAAREHGHDPRRLRVGTHYQVYCSENSAEAREVVKGALQRYNELSAKARQRGFPAGRGPKVEEPDVDEVLAEGRICVGTPDECVAILERGRDVLGLDQIDCQFQFGGIPYEQVRRSHRLFATEVMPRLRAPAPQAAPARA